MVEIVKVIKTKVFLMGCYKYLSNVSKYPNVYMTPSRVITYHYLKKSSII